MRDEDHRNFAFEPVDRAGELIGGLRVETARRFIEDQNLWPLQ